MVIVKKNNPIYHLEASVFFRKFGMEFIGRLDQISKRLDYLEEMANKNDYEFSELKKDLENRLDDVDAGIIAIEEQIEEGALKEVENNGYIRGLEHAQKVIDKTFKK